MTEGGEETAELTATQKPGESNSTKNNRNESMECESPAEGWLDLSLGGNLQAPNGADSEPQPLMNKPSNLAPKVFSCNFCMRKFYSSQALGGHQNAHKRERGAVRRYKFQRIMAMMGLPLPLMNNAANLMVRSLSVRPHSLGHSHGGSSAAATTAARFDGDGGGGKRLKMAAAAILGEELMDMGWPGSFRFNSQQETEPLKLDLNLRL
ncbi:zinc finger protein 4-like [Momordica charantia]|uniref:Zinc finger protein 4-like n=1 Tax=Momordica charantia TaxID=3673 RepID=A0A6J1D3Z2_MOMCH|nr:zinc finger protein 4-like [Momordica charantia]XP_022148805.1 zinc finger protein 4-like [Momordica charantia]